MAIRENKSTMWSSEFHWDKLQWWHLMVTCSSNLRLWEKVRRPKTDVLPMCHATNQIQILFTFVLLTNSFVTVRDSWTITTWRTALEPTVTTCLWPKSGRGSMPVFTRSFRWSSSSPSTHSSCGMSSAHGACAGTSPLSGRRRTAPVRRRRRRRRRQRSATASERHRALPTGATRDRTPGWSRCCWPCRSRSSPPRCRAVPRSSPPSSSTGHWRLEQPAPTTRLCTKRESWAPCDWRWPPPTFWCTPTTPPTSSSTAPPGRSSGVSCVPSRTASSVDLCASRRRNSTSASPAPSPLDCDGSAAPGVWCNLAAEADARLTRKMRGRRMSAFSLSRSTYKPRITEEAHDLHESRPCNV